ncbi:MAG TPA: XRE family transcriptional regulator [Natronosporangium sp.]
MRAANLDVVDVAARVGVDPKTVGQWLKGRIPFPRNRAALAALTGWPERDLWPGLARPTRAPTTAEVRVTYPYRSAVPADAWRHLFAGAEQEINVLAYSALFLAEDAAIVPILREKARAGVRVRIALGDPDGRQVFGRGADEGIGDIIATRIHNALVLFAPLKSQPGVQLRLHDTVLYNSIYRADDDLLVNTHAYRCPASHAPVLHLRRASDDGMAAAYTECFERIWATARSA